MANSLRAKLSKLRHDGHITDAEYNAFIKKMDGHEQEIRAKTIDEFAKQLKSDEFQKYNLDMVFETSRDLSYSHCINAFHEYVDEIAEQLKVGVKNE